jgi:dTDP-L-rhamnose 4-epimerase
MKRSFVIMANVLITGGAGFVGSHLADALLERGHRVRVYDCLEPQVHANGRPQHLSRDVELVVGDVRDRDSLRRALTDVEVLFHYAAQVGVGQSMYEVERYVSANSIGAGILLDIVANERKTLPLRKMIVASSMSVYGEGAYRCRQCGIVFPRERSVEQMIGRRWEVECPAGHGATEPTATDENKPLAPASIYAITKRDHEEMFLCIGRAYDVPTVALRYFNIYGSRQALTNPYTGVAAIFCGRLLNGQAPMVFEDGNQRRDFVHVSDVVQANLLAMERSQADLEVLNVGSGEVISISQLAELLIDNLAPGSAPLITGKYRQGDIRHCYADITKAERLLDYRPRMPMREGVADLIQWVKHQQPHPEHVVRVRQMKEELESRGLSR